MKCSFFDFPLRIKRRLSKALVVSYDPIVDINQGGWFGAQARLSVRAFGRVFSDEQIALVVRALRLNRVLTRTTCLKVAKDYCEVLRLCGHLSLSINITLKDLKDESFPDFVHGVFSTYGIAPSSIIFEVSGLHGLHSAVVHRQLLALRQSGFRIAFNDRQLGFVSLSMGHDLPIDIVKLSSDFLRMKDVCVNKRALNLFNVSRRLGLVLFAEGVRTSIEHKSLRLQEVRYARGEFYSSQLTARVFTRQFFSLNCGANR